MDSIWSAGDDRPWSSPGGWGTLPGMRYGIYEPTFGEYSDAAWPLEDMRSRILAGPPRFDR